MTMMLAPDLLDRRALAHLVLMDAFGQAVRSPALVTGEGVRVLFKNDGSIVVLEAPGFEEYTRSFASPPGSPAVGSKTVALEIVPAEARLQSRVVELKLPRDPDPAKFDQPESLFHPVEVTLLPTPLQKFDAFACVLRVRVHRKGDKALVAGALVRAKSNNNKFEAMAITDRAGEAALVFPGLPFAFAGSGGSTVPSLPAKAVVKVDPASAIFTPPGELDLAGGSFRREAGHYDPDKLAGGAAPSFAGGTPFDLAAGTEPSIAIEWEQP